MRSNPSIERDVQAKSKGVGSLCATNTTIAVQMESDAVPAMRVGPSKSARRAQISNHLKRLGLRALVVSVKEKAETSVR